MDILRRIQKCVYKHAFKAIHQDNISQSAYKVLGV